MANFFTDNQDLVDRFRQLDLADIVTELEGGFRAEVDDAPANYDEAMDVYGEALTLLGDISANFIAPRSAGIDSTGTELVDGKVSYAPMTLEAKDVLSESGFMGVMLPREYGGSNFPATVYMMLIEMVSRADASLMTMFGYQDVGELIARFGTPEQGEKFLPRLASGEHIGAIVLSEPGSGSDLQSIKVRAELGDDGVWRLNGTKHFISNGCGDVLMVLARSESNISNIFGLSLFACAKSDAVKIMRVEEKMGLHGSPTCEILFDNAPADLIGQRKLGLTKYILESLNQARFSVAAQAIGIAEAAYHAALLYAQQRVQFKQKIIDFAAVSEMLVDIRVAIESSRAMVLEGATWLDRRNQLAHRMEAEAAQGEASDETRNAYRNANKINSLLSPMVKYVATEAATRACHQAQQVFGGMGYMRETGIERLVRDVRITTIYEGTSEVQVAGSLKHVMADTLGGLFDGWAEQVSGTGDELSAALAELRATFQVCADLASASGDKQVLDASARGLVDIYASVLGGYLLLRQAKDSDRKALIARRYIVDAKASAAKTRTALTAGKYSDLEQRDTICGIEQ